MAGRFCLENQIQKGQNRKNKEILCFSWCVNVIFKIFKYMTVFDQTKFLCHEILGLDQDPDTKIDWLRNH